jgi:hypothetical protein
VIQKKKQSLGKIEMKNDVGLSGAHSRTLMMKSSMPLLGHHNEKILGCSLHLPYRCFFFYTGAKFLTPTEEIKRISEELNK